MFIVEPPADISRRTKSFFVVDSATTRTRTSGKTEKANFLKGMTPRGLACMRYCSHGRECCLGRGRGECRLCQQPAAAAALPFGRTKAGTATAAEVFVYAIVKGQKRALLVKPAGSLPQPPRPLVLLAALYAP